MDIRNVKSITDLIGYFSENLGWNVDIDDFDDIDDISYDFTAADVGLKEELFAKISSLKQLQPLVDNQQWGIFCIEFKSSKFEASALRKVLSGLIPRRRNSADHAVWAQQDLLFICNWGTEDNKTIGIAHFEDKEHGLPQIKMISCAPALEDFTQIKNFENSLAKLSWPKNTSNIEEWRQHWASAFSIGYHQIIKDSSTLTIQLAAEAQNIRNHILEIMSVESNMGYVHRLYWKFTTTLIHDLSLQEFADMYAQTIVYGLFSARCMSSGNTFSSLKDAINAIPNTNPFLAGILKGCVEIGGNALSFDELEIEEVIDLLNHAQTDLIIKDFNRQTGGGKEDPVIHFYEEFLTAYDKEQKVQRGVFYTPQPIVKFLVSAVDYILKNSFGFEDGLATDAKRKVKIKRKSKKTIDGLYRTIEEVVDVPAVQILDPATGTGTFVRQVILQIYENFKMKYSNLSNDCFHDKWNEYVSNNLLNNINAFELMMAPYAVTHMKLAMVLKDTGYDFADNKRLKVYLTNSLEKPGNSDEQPDLFSDPLAQESIEANQSKINNGINIVIGNPPYSGESSNNNEWIQSLMEDYKKEPGGKIKLQEQNSKWINDDYVKFIRYAHYIIDRADNGIIAYINPHGFLDNPTFRGMRWSLLQSFSRIYILDLHGNKKKKEKCPDGTNDENVFDIQQGTCLFIAVKEKDKSLKKNCVVYHSDLWGLRNYKYSELNHLDLTSINWTEIVPTGDDYVFIPRNDAVLETWNKGFKLDEAFPLNGVGICSKRDPIAYQDSKESIVHVLNDFKTLSEDEIRIKYHVDSESRDQKISYAKDNIKNYGIKDEYLRECLYRPFDKKWTYYTDKVRGFLAYPVYKVLGNMIHENIGLISSRQGQASDVSQWNVAFATDCIVDLNVFRRGGGCLFPLYKYTNDYLGTGERIVNISKDVLNGFSTAMGKVYSEKGNKDYGPRDIFNYVYAILYSKNYREYYSEFLKLEFPRIPYPTSFDNFKKIGNLGKQLVELHTMKDWDSLNISDYKLSEGSNTINKISYKSGKIYINKEQYINNVPEELWSFTIGGYQPLQKWLKDRKEYTLTNLDTEHYQYMISALSETIKIMDYIDSIVNFNSIL